MKKLRYFCSLLTSNTCCKPSHVLPLELQLEEMQRDWEGSKMNSKVIEDSIKAQSAIVPPANNASIINGEDKKLNSKTNSSKSPETSLDIQFNPGNGPLLGSEELVKYLPGQKATIQVTTWNMGSLPLPKEYHLRKIFYHDEDDSLKNVDIHVVSIQECWPDADAWELELQVCLGPSFALFHSLSFGTLHISVFLRRDLLWFTTEPSDSTISVRSGRLFKTKGAASINFGFFGSKFMFVSAHLSAGEEIDREKQRIDELKKILTTYQKTTAQNMDAMFLCGDLNFRISMKREEILENLKKNNLQAILERDQLNIMFQRKDTLPKCLEEFHEAAAITFRPSYKFDIGTDKFDTSNKKRSPAYTDRVIYKSKLLPDDTPVVVCLAYEAVTSMRISDHKPVYSVFSVHVKPGFDTLPISGAKFKKDVYTKAVQKRAKFLLDRRKKLASTVCSLS